MVHAAQEQRFAPEVPNCVFICLGREKDLDGENCPSLSGPRCIRTSTPGPYAHGLEHRCVAARVDTLPQLESDTCVCRGVRICRSRFQGTGPLRGVFAILRSESRILHLTLHTRSGLDGAWVGFRACLSTLPGAPAGSHPWKPSLSVPW